MIDKNSFGQAEVQDAINANHGIFSSAFWLALDDFSIDTFNSFNVAIPTPTGPFASLPGVTISPLPATPGGPTPSLPIPVYENPTSTGIIQQIRFSFDVTFASPLITPFPVCSTADYSLTATFTTNGTAVPGANSQATVNFELA